MSGGIACRCAERREPLKQASDSNRPARLWRVSQLKCNHSAFNGGHYTSSDYSSIICLRCGASWRTKSDKAFALPQFDFMKEGQISRGYASHESAMARLGRTPCTNREDGMLPQTREDAR